MIRKTLLLVLLAVLPLSLFAQDQAEQKSVIGNDKYSVYTNRFGDNWFMSVGAGPQVYFGEDDSEGPFEKRISSSIDIGFGKWFTPGLALRLQFSGIQARGWGYEGKEAYLYGTPNSKGLYRQKWNIGYIHGDVMFNLTNLFCGYRENRVYSIIPVIGFGWLHTTDWAERQYFGFNFGLLNRFHVSKAWDINLEARAMITTASFSGTRAGKTGGDAMYALNIGATYYFKTRGFTNRPIVKEGVPYEEMKRVQNKLKEQESLNTNLQSELAEEKSKPPVVKEVVKVVNRQEVTVPRIIFFTINKSTLTSREKVNIRYIADEIKLNTYKTYTIKGYADNATGSEEYNRRLSQQRAKTVYNVLVNDYGVNESQLKIEAKGGVNKMYESNALTRIVVVE